MRNFLPCFAGLAILKYPQDIIAQAPLKVHKGFGPLPGGRLDLSRRRKTGGDEVHFVAFDGDL